MKFNRITVDPRQMDGVPCIRRLRIPVAAVIGMVADGMTREEILKAYPDLKAKDVEEALRYAAEAVRERELPLRRFNLVCGGIAEPSPTGGYARRPPLP